MLSPWQRWRKYGVFPWKLVLHIIIALASTLLIFMYNSVHGVASVSVNPHTLLFSLISRNSSCRREKSVRTFRVPSSPITTRNTMEMRLTTLRLHVTSSLALTTWLEGLICF